MENKTKKNRRKAVKVCCEGWREHNYIEVTKAYRPLKAVQECVHHALEGGWNIAPAERHGTKLIKAIWHSKCGLLTVNLIDGRNCQ